MRIKKFRGQKVEIENNIYKITIHKPHVRRGERVKIGLSDALVNAALASKGKVRVVVPERFLDFTIFAWEAEERGKRKEMPSKFGKPWYMFMIEILPEEWDRADKRESEQERLDNHNYNMLDCIQD